MKLKKKKKLNPWVQKNSIKNKLKKSYIDQFSNNLILNDKIFKKITKKKKKIWLLKDEIENWSLGSGSDEILGTIK
jgi:hypothetical protein